MRRTRILTGILLTLMLPAASKAAPDDPYLVYVVNREVTKGQSWWPVLVRGDASTGALTEVSRNGPQGNLFVHPYDLAAEHDGSLVVVDMGRFASDDASPDGAVIRVDPTTGAQTAVSSGGELVDPAGVAVAPDGALYVLENVGRRGEPAVIRVDPHSGAQSTVAEGGELCYPFGIALEADGDILVTDYGDHGVAGRPVVDCPRDAGCLIRIDREGGRQTVVSQGGLFGKPFGLAVESSGRILVANEVNALAAVMAIDPVTGAQAAVTPNDLRDLFRLPERIAIAPDGDLLVSDFELEDRFGGIVRVAPGGGQSIAWQGELFSNPLGVAVVVNRPPTAALSASSPLVAGGQPVTFDASASRDPEGLRLRYDWDLDGDGAFERRTAAPTAALTPGASGTLTAHVRVRDPHGASATAGAAVTVDATAPVLDSFRASARTILGRAPSKRSRGRGRRPRPRADAVRAPRRTTFGYRLSEPATVTVWLGRVLPGQRVGDRCLPPARRAVRRRARCPRWRHMVTLREQQPAGPNGLRFSGRVGGRRLVAGHYRATAAATDAVGNESPRTTTRLRVVAPRR
ncbi:MAG: PKD domain-containing protein [Thermoleophilaceae bacterium]|nr:PKD domain-containing protein [Thermoleophilaceae bacterium]